MKPSTIELDSLVSDDLDSWLLQWERLGLLYQVVRKGYDWLTKIS